MKKILAITIVLAAAALFAAAAWALTRTDRAEFYVARLLDDIVHIPMTEMFYDRTNFIDSQASAADTPPERGIRAVVVPHHLLASRLVADALARTSGTEYKTIVVVGPNHDDRGPDIVSSVSVAYDAPNGIVWPDQDKVAEVRELFASRSDASVFVPEHSVGAMIPFVRETYPDARLVPIILSSRAGSAESERLSAWLAAQGPDTLVVFSVDFSHYLTKEAAEDKDKETKAAIETSDIATIAGWGNDHIDSPFTVITALELAEKIGAKAEIVDHANANDFLSISDVSTTSYFEIIVK